ncbi:hypothetical protein SODALDRAFT_194111 [Sodiomyces alkalinus F11]|uniref:Secreted protein n=1 Tax=Sodiomyces alkalinus (strain CBS 110278 / VKM F-3762 / F11) TaxID=1314773 RepID=A0A3N2PS26_SODAK|nr:hypothetical protein SODALDRAFT_194111 [Sodiomyces alkalinus F11]ROT37313.1 hypothetical protein SODALDRAFT_194111 [Sodiomyces alkalinus F11]
MCRKSEALVLLAYGWFFWGESSACLNTTDGMINFFFTRTRRKTRGLAWGFHASTVLSGSISSRLLLFDCSRYSSRGERKAKERKGKGIQFRCFERQCAPFLFDPSVRL